DCTKAEIIRNWLNTVLLQLDLYQSFPRTQWCYLEDLDAGLRAIGDQLRLPLAPPEGVIRDDVKSFKLQGDNIPPAWSEYSEAVLSANRLYHQLRSATLNPSKGYRGVTNPAFQQLRLQIAALWDRMNQDDATPLAGTEPASGGQQRKREHAAEPLAH